MKELYPYQEQGVMRINSFLDTGNHGVLLADEPGLGKTVQALQVVRDWECQSVLVVCPSSLKLNWRDEALDHLDNQWTIHVLRGRNSQPVTPGWPIVTIVNYDLLQHLDFGLCEYDLVIYDEAHRMKNPKAKRTKAAAKIVCKRRLLLTGTPIINRPRELFQLMVLCGFAKPADFHAFGVKYCAAFKEWIYIPGGNGKRKQVWNYDGSSNLDELNAWLNRLVMVRRRKADVLTDLPPKTRRIITMEGAERDAQIAYKLHRLLDDRGAYEKRVSQLEDQIKVCFEEISLLRHETALENIDQKLDYIEDALRESDKVVVFCHHRDIWLKIHERFCSVAAGIIGGMNDAEKHATVERFQNNPGTKLFIGQMQAAGEGITLTAASRVIFVELDWSPAAVTQCEDRCHRIGQKDNVLVEHLVVDGSLDARIAKRLVEKQKILDSAIDGSVSGEVDWLSELGSH